MSQPERADTLLHQLEQMEEEMIFVDPDDQTTVTALQDQMSEIMIRLNKKGEGLARYIQFIKTTADKVEAEAKAYRAVYQKLATRAESMRNGLKWVLENTLRPIVARNPNGLKVDGHSIKIVKAPRSYTYPEVADLQTIQDAYGEEDAAILESFVVRPKPYVNWAAVRERMMEIHRQLKGNIGDPDLVNELAKLRVFVDDKQGDYVRMY